MGQQFEYDEKGTTFLYFLLSFFAMILIPLSYVFWPKGLKEEEKRLRNQILVHGKSKWYKKVQGTLQRKKSKPSFRKMFLVLCWVGFFVLVYKVSNLENDYIEYNPYVILGLDESAEKGEIKQKFRQLLKENHPDKGGDADTFMKIRKAYEALTDEKVSQIVKEFGTPDGAQAPVFGIALPKWIVESQNSVFVLGIYMLLFMILLPVVVGIWWNRSIKYSKEQVLLNTTQLYFYFFNKTPNMNLKRALMIFSSSFEFSRDHNSKVRASTPKDNEEIPELMRLLESYSVTENAKERPLNFPYSVKARILIYCHLCRIEMPSLNLDTDLEFILTKSPLLIQEMVNCLAQLTAMAHWNKATLPRLETLENVMKLSPMMVQGLRDTKSPLLQLPYFNDDFVKYCHSYKKSTVRSLKGLVQLRESERRQLLRRMGDEEYDTMLNTLRTFPDVEIVAETQVMDDEDVNVITAGAIVTVTLRMFRSCLGDLIVNTEDQNVETIGTEPNEDQNKEGEKQIQKAKIWEKSSKKKKNVKKKKPAKPGKKANKKGVKPEEAASGEAESNHVTKKKLEEESTSESEGGSDSDSDAPDVHDDQKDDEEWQAMQSTFKRKNKDALISDKRTHTVYAPNFPTEKQEWWWTYVCDRKRHLLLTAPVLVCNLRDEQEIEVKFPAPQKPGRYTYTMWLRCDSYLDCDQRCEIKLDVQEAKPIDEDHPQWKDDEDEDGEGNDSEDEGISSEELSSSDEE